MTEPSVCAICLTADRPEMTRQAVESFRAQTYANKRLYICDTGIEPCGLLHLFSDQIGVFDCRKAQASEPRTIGELRNMAGRVITSEILIHWDSDDWSHPNRIAEQVALLQSSGADVVGYREMLFWREPVNLYTEPGEAWLYSNKNPNYALGTSLCYWRHVWERKPFEATSQGEDDRFLRGLKVAAVSAMDNLGVVRVGDNPPPDCFDVRMIARIHPGNTSTAYSPAKMQRAAEWRRVPHWDTFCAETMK